MGPIKIIQIATSITDEENMILGLSDDGKLYRWESKFDNSPCDVTHEAFGWVEMVDQINVSDEVPEENVRKPVGPKCLKHGEAGCLECFR